MPKHYTLHCPDCQFSEDIVLGEFFSPFDSQGRLWEYSVFVCPACGMPESKYLPKNRVQARCRTCGSKMQKINPILLTAIQCPVCKKADLILRRKVVFHKTPIRNLYFAHAKNRNLVQSARAMPDCGL